MRRPLFVALIALALGGTLSAEPVPPYLLSANPDFAWKVAEVKRGEGFSVHYVRLTSQVWQGIPWEHWLSVVVPDDLSAEHGEHALLFVDGGSQSEGLPRRVSQQHKMFGESAIQTGTIMAILRQVPNQPLFDGLREDALIAHTFVQFLETGDASWPALMPMTRAAMSAMDVVQQLARRELEHTVDHFFVTGASKRGWTTWLTGAVDPRVSGIAPMVIDTLNFPEQMELQKKAFGTYSIQIRDYTERDLPERTAEPRAQQLIRMVDPYSHRDRLELPKLLVLGTKDPYWPVDAVGLYFGGLVGEKHIHYMPNTGHAPGPTALQAISAFYMSIITGAERPQMGWSLDERDGEVRIVVECDVEPEGAWLWTSTSPDRDFRDDDFTDRPVEGKHRRWVVEVPLPEEGFLAAYVALEFASEAGHNYTFCTEVKIFEAEPWF